MTKTGENLQREWDAEPQAPELWDALQVLKRDHLQGKSELAAISEQGSALAMMYLGDTLSKSQIEDEAEQAELWLRRSADAGSIEGRFQLARHFERMGKGQAAVEEYAKLGSSGYPPSMFCLGVMFYQGTLVERDLGKSVEYFKHAKEAGHLPAMGYLAWIYRKEGFGLSGRIAAHWNCLAKIPEGTWYILKYPNSDRMRGFYLPSSKGGNSR